MSYRSKRKGFIAFAVILILALLAAVIWLIVAAALNTNALCLFKHNYADDGICTRCGAEQPAEEPAEEIEQPGAFTSEPVTLVMTVAQIPQLYAATLPPKVNYSFNAETRIMSFTPNATVEKWRVRILSSSAADAQCYLEQTYTDYAARTISLSSYFANGVLKYNKTYLVSIDYSSKNSVNVYEYDYNLSENLYVTRISEVPPAPTKTGYTFTGWYTDEACTNKYTAATVTDDITLYAGFTAHTYSIKFNANSGSGTMDNLPMTYDQAKNLTTNTFTKDHYAFKGWATSANGAVVYEDEETVENLTATDGATVELFAVWERSEVKVDFVVDGNTTTTWIAIGTKATLPSTPTKEGYNFIAWLYDDGTIYDEQIISEDITLTAYFEIIQCTVTFIVDGEVYAVYVCDWGTSLGEALNANNVNPLLMSVEGEYRRNF